jgi:hypothetical protein
MAFTIYYGVTAMDNSDIFDQSSNHKKNKSIFNNILDFKVLRTKTQNSKLIEKTTQMYCTFCNLMSHRIELPVLI